MTTATWKFSFAEDLQTQVELSSIRDAVLNPDFPKHFPIPGLCNSLTLVIQESVQNFPFQVVFGTSQMTIRILMIILYTVMILLAPVGNQAAQVVGECTSVQSCICTSGAHAKPFLSPPPLLPRATKVEDRCLSRMFS